jgi:hypothetical protein
VQLLGSLVGLFSFHVTLKSNQYDMHLSKSAVWICIVLRAVLLHHWCIVMISSECLASVVLPQVLVLNPRLLYEAREQHIASQLCTTKWADVEGKVLWFGAGEDEAKPLCRVCGLHATQAIQYAQEKGWLKHSGDRPRRLSNEDLTIDEAAWASPTFDKERMQAFLRNLPDTCGSDEAI